MEMQLQRFQWLLSEIIRQFEMVEKTIKSLMAKLPYIGSVAADYSNLIMLTIVMVLTVFVLKPLVKWSIGILAIGALLAGVLSYFSGLTFWGVLPLTALGAGIVMFSNKFKTR
jgi:hypothetical protein